MERGNIRKFFSAKNIAYIAVLLALVIVLQAFGGTISIGVVQLNFTLIPIVLGAILFGPVVGALLGFACGVVVLVQVIMGLSPFYTVIWTESPVVTVFTCIVKTTVAGLVAGFLYRLIAKRNQLASVFVAAGVVPVINTGLFILGCLCMNGAISSFQGSVEMGSMNIFVFIVVVLVTWNFFIEFAVNLVLAPAVCRVVQITEKYFLKKYKAKKPVAEPGSEEATEPEGETAPEISASTAEPSERQS